MTVHRSDIITPSTRYRLVASLFRWIFLGSFAVVLWMADTVSAEGPHAQPNESEAQIAQRASAAWEHGDI
ncbi:hypothetical protein, partial [Petrachloros mirabilis]